MSEPLEFSTFCSACMRDCTFVAFGENDRGLVGECAGCGAVRIKYFTRENTEVPKKCA